MMKKIGFSQLAAFAFVFVLAANAQQTQRRFGFEYNDIEPWGHPKHELLLGKLAQAAPGGDINLNGFGNWAAMQSGPNAPINFVNTDSVVRLLGRHGFALALNLSPNAEWAFPNKPDCQYGLLETKDCAPEPAFEQHWINFIKAFVERYDGDGVQDMPGLQQPVRHYIMTGEIKFGQEGTGDDRKGPFWYDTIGNLLRFHRITYRAIHDADPSGNSKLVSSGAVLWDLYADFPDYPQFDPASAQSLIQRRLRGENFKGRMYTAGWDSLKKMLASFGNDADGVECDYIGWHPHFSWRTIDQEFQFIRAHAANKPIYVDDMWSNIFPVGRFGPPPLIPGEAQFNAPQNIFASLEWIKRIHGDFPNAIVTGGDPHRDLFDKLNAGNQTALNWYYANGARRLVKSFASAFGEGAVAANFSGTNDLSKDSPLGALIGRGSLVGWINLTGTQPENYAEKPQYYTYKLLVEKLRDFTAVTEITVSSNPRTRVYKFDRPRGPIYVLWSETGDAPPNLDYRIATGETVTFPVESEALLLTRIVTDLANIQPRVENFAAPNRRVTIQLGYEPIFLEGITVEVAAPQISLPATFALEQNMPNPFYPSTTIRFSVPATAQVTVAIYNMLGQKVRTLTAGRIEAGYHQLVWDGRNDGGKPAASGVYFLQMRASAKNANAEFVRTRKLVLME